MNALEEYRDYARHSEVGHNYATPSGLRKRAGAAIAELEEAFRYAEDERIEYVRLYEGANERAERAEVALFAEHRARIEDAVDHGGDIVTEVERRKQAEAERDAMYQACADAGWAVTEGEPEKFIAALLAELERLRVCGACVHCRWQHSHPTECFAGDSPVFVTMGRRECLYAPPRWRERTP